MKEGKMIDNHVGQKFTTNKKHNMIGFLFVLPAIIFIVLFVIYPVAYNVWLSFTNSILTKNTYRFIGLQNYEKMFTNRLFGKYFWNTCVWTFWSVLGQIVLGLGIALLISKPMKGGTLLRSFLLIPYVVPAITLALVTKWTMNSDYGIISYWLQQAKLLQNRQSLLAIPASAMASVIILNIWRSFPFPMLIYWAAIKGINRELYDAAKVDGAGNHQLFRYVTMPQLHSTTVVLVVLRTIWTATYYDLIYMVTGGGPAGATTTLPILIYQASFGSYRIGYAAALSMILGALMLVCVIFYIKKSGVIDN